MAIMTKMQRTECSNPRRCLEHLWFDMMYRGSRYRMPANDFAVPRMEQASSGRSSRWRRRAIGSGSSSARFRPDAIHGVRAHNARRR